MANGIVTPLQLTATGALLNNQGIKSLPAALTAAIAAFESTAVIADFLTALTTYQAQSFATEATLLSLQSIGNTTCAALGDSIPSTYTNLIPVVDPGGFSGLITQTGNAYLGNGNTAVFCSNFTAVEAAKKTVNNFINSAVNAQTYLGPTFSGMDSFTTNSISNINPNFDGFATDLFNQGNLTSFSDIDLYGTPAGLLKQLAFKANIRSGTLLSVQNSLLNAGLTKAQIKILVSRPVAVPDNEFNQLQKIAYKGMLNVTGADLQQVLDILDVKTPNIVTMADLLNQQIIFPNSWTTLQTPTPTGWVSIYQPDGSVNSNLEPNVALFLPTPTGCEDLSKIIPPAQAVANKATQVALQQISGLLNTTLPKLAQTIMGIAPTQWDITRSYISDSIVSSGMPIPTNFRAQQFVPQGTDITDTAYWLPTDLGGLSTMADLPLIQDETVPISSTTAGQFSAIATGSGPNGTLTTCDFIGLAIDYDDFAGYLNTATAAINTLDGLGALNTLKSDYVSIAAAANNGQAISRIANANASVAAVLAAQPALCATLNTAFDAMANILSQQKTLQTNAGIDYNVTGVGTASIYSFVQSLPTYGQETGAGDAAYFLNQVADTSIAGGQAIIGAMREGVNNRRLGLAGLGTDLAPPTEPAITPVPAVNPVY